MARKLTHGELIHEVWPDKSLFGAVMLFITGLVGVSFVAFQAVVDVTFSEKVPAFLRDYPAWITVLLSLASFVLAAISLRQRDTTWALWGAGAGILSMGLLGVGSVLSLVALTFLLLSRLEKEDYNPDTLRLTSEHWPDKSLAASLLMLMTGIVALVWGLALVTNLFNLEIAQGPLIGQGSIVAGLVCLFAASQLYYQRAVWIGWFGVLAGTITFGFYVVGPALSIAALVLITLAHREREFDKATKRAASTVPQR